VPAETHQHHAPIEVTDVVELLARLLDLDPDRDDLEAVRLADVGVDDDLGIFALWGLVTDELAERTVGELDVDDARVGTLGELARAFTAVLTPDQPG
jgi:hypothetical protein